MRTHAELAKLIVEPAPRGGSTTTAQIVQSANAHPTRTTERRRLPEALGRISGDANLAYLAERTRNYAELTDARLEALERALDADEPVAVENVAQALTEACTRLGAIHMMRLGIALQMLGRRGLWTEARRLFAELKVEHARFKETLICI